MMDREQIGLRVCGDPGRDRMALIMLFDGWTLWVSRTRSDAYRVLPPG